MLPLPRGSLARMEGPSLPSIQASSRSLARRLRISDCSSRDVPNGKHKLFFSSDLTLTGEEVLKCYRSRFLIEFCFRDAKPFAGFCDCQARES